MVPDILFYALLGLSGGSFILLLALILGIRVVLNTFGPLVTKFNDIPATIRGLIDQFVWVESEEEDKDGKKVKVRRPNPQLVAELQTIMPVIAPVIAKEMIEWGKKNIKLGGLPGAGGGVGLDLANLDPSALIGMLPKKIQPWAGLAMPFLGKFLGGGGGVTSSGKSIGVGGALTKELPK